MNTRESICAVLAVGSLAIALLAMPQGPVRAASLAVHDDDGRVLQLAAPARRIVSLSAGATALLFAAGAGDRVVGTASYSDEPAAARAIERVGDARGFDVERIVVLRPDVVVGWPQGGALAEIGKLEKLGIPVYHHRLQRLDDLAPVIERLGQLAGTGVQAHAVANGLRARIDALRAAHARATPRTMLVQLWDQPVFTVGGAQVLSDVVAACGYRNAFGELAGAAPVVSSEAVAARDPDAILALADTAGAADAWLARWRALGTLKSARSGHLWSWSDPRLTRMGPSIVDAAEALCAALDAGLPTHATAAPRPATAPATPAALLREVRQAPRPPPDRPR